jgi:carboxypeptidase PM20D1
LLKRLVLLIVLIVTLVIIICLVRTLKVRPAEQAAGTAPHVAVDDAAAVGRLAGAIRIQTISEPLTPPNQPAMLALRTYFEQSFPRVHATLKREVVGDGSLLFTWRGSDPSLAPLLLMGHMDVVPVDTTSLDRWKHPPFAGDIADGYVWGRGASDDKAAVVSVLEAAEALLAQGFAPKRTIIFAFGDDEENDGHGAEQLSALLKSRGVRPEMVMDEGGFIAHRLVPGVSGDVALVSVAEKGIASVQLQVDAPGGHSSRPPKHTAIGRLSEALVKLEKHPMPARISPTAGMMLDALAPQMGFGERLVVSNRWLLEPVLVASLENTPSGNALVRTTTALTMMNAGVKDNVLPTQATAVANFRILPGDTIQRVLDHVRSVVNDPQVHVALYPTTAGEASPESPTDGPGYDLLRGTIEKFFPNAPVTPNLLVARTDSVHYYQLTPDVYRFFPAVRTEVDIESIHGINERMGIADYAKAVQFMAALMQGAQN